MKWTRLLALWGVVAIGSLGAVACDDDDDPQPTAPAAPTGVSATVSGTSITVTWNAVQDADSYRAELTTSGESPRSQTAPGGTTTATFDGLTQGKTYTAQVFAINTAGETGSGVVQADIPGVGAPGTPTDVSVSVAGPNEATVSWTSGGNTDEFRVTVSTSGENDRTETTSGTDATFDDLTEATTYSAVVTAINSEDETNAAAVQFSTESTFVEVTDDVTENTTWTADKTWVLTRPIFVGVDCGPDPANPTNDCQEATLTIEPGTTVIGAVDLPQGLRSSFLVVNRGSRIVADANADVAGDQNVRPAPEDVIVFTSERARGSRVRGDWGGIILNGRAPTNTFDDDDGGALGEGNSGFYGGFDDDDDSGILRGVRIEFAGDDATPTDQLNGLAMQGTGAGTTLSYIQIHYNTDDGIEPYGGTASVNHLVVTGIGDDSVDGTDGYRGFMQFIVGQQRGDEADQGMELSNNGDDASLTPKTTAVIANATMIGANDGVVSGTIAGPTSDHGMLFREGSHYRIYNSIFTGFGDSGLCVEDAPTAANADARVAGGTDPDNTLAFENNVLWMNNDPAGGDGNFCDESAEGGYSVAENQTLFNQFNNVLADPGLPSSAFDVGSQGSPPDVIPGSAIGGGYTAFDLTTIAYDDDLVMPLDGRMLVDTDYAGAVEPGTAVADAWYAGWTVWSTNGSDSRPNQNGN
jgi:hypothetical protein